MTTEHSHINVSGVSVEIVRKGIKNLHLGVYPPHGRVRVAAPLRVSNNAVRLAVIGKLGWIRRQRARFDGQQRQSEREYVSGESHYFLGRRYRLNVIHHEGAGIVVLRGRTTMNLYVREDTDRAHRDLVVSEWYRRQLKEMIPPLIEQWSARIHVRPSEWRVRRMKTKWGTCNIQARRIWLNLELVKKPIECLEYIVVHELLHLKHRQHDEQFTALLDRFMPRWKLHKETLNRSPLSHESWEY